MKYSVFSIKKLAKILFIFLMLYVVYGIQSTAKVSAQQQALSLQVAPARQEISVDPGDQTAVSVRFFNLSDLPVSGFVRASDFIVNDNDGTAVLIDDVQQASPRFSAASWVTMAFDTIAISANDLVSVQAKINVPANARPGGRYIAIYFEPSSNLPTAVTDNQAAGATVAQRIAALVYIRVNGPITEKALISRFEAPSFLEYGPITLESDILNKGDYHIRPRGNISVKNMIGGLVDQQAIDEVNIFPDTTRSYINALGNKWMFGKYSVELIASYGETGQTITRAVSVWVFPWKVALVVILALIILLIIIRYFYKKLVVKEAQLEDELEKEHEEVEKLKEELGKKD